MPATECTWCGWSWLPPWVGLGKPVNKVMEPSFSLKVLDLKGAVRTVDRIMWNTTAKELLERLHPSIPPSQGISLVEIWHECFKRIPMEKTLSSVIREWGYAHISSDCVRIAILRNPKWRHNHKYLWKRRKYVHVRSNKTHKRKYQIGRSKVSMVNAISCLTRQILDEKKVLDDLVDPALIHEESHPASVQELPEKMQEQGKALVEAIEEEKQEMEELQRRKAELSEKIKAKEKTLEKAKKKASDLNAQVLNEHHKLKNLKESRNAPEIEQITRDITQVKEETAVRMKLNKMQLNKMTELTEAVLQAEEELKACDREIELLHQVV